MINNELIKYADIEHVGIEIFKKFNREFYKSNLSPIMERIFNSSNKQNKSIECDDKYYRKSGAIPERVYYIYSDKLKDINTTKIYDVVLFKNNKCIWFYPENIFNMIENDPVNSINNIYTILLDTFFSPINKDNITFIDIENSIVRWTLIIRLINFIYENYGYNKVKIDLLRDDIIDLINSDYKILMNKKCTKESINVFIDNTLDGFYSENYFRDKIYLDSYMVLKEDKEQ